MKLYVCSINWQHEIGEAADLEGKMPFYTSLEQLKKEHECWEECGITEVEVLPSKVIKESEI